jgi:heme a synthase
VVGIAAFAVILAVWRWAPGRQALLRLSMLPLVGVFAQALLGGVTVLTGLNPATVAAHFLLSMVIVAISTLLLYRAGEGDAPAVPTVRPEVRTLAWATSALGAVVLALGTVVTGSGPHSGDAQHPTRFGFDPRAVSWVHADAVMLFAGLVVAVLLAVRLTNGSRHARRAWLAVLLVTLAQGVVGYTQYFTGLPEAVVALHMLGASLLVVVLTCGVLSLRTR